MSRLTNFMRSTGPVKFRLLPVLMGSAAVLLALKCTNIAVDVDYLISPARAASAEEMAKTSHAAADPAKAGAAGTAAKAASAADDAVQDTSEMSRSEIGLLQELSARRGELKQRESQLDMRERLLQATEKRVNDKIAALKTSEAEIKKLMGAVDEQQEAKLKSLVRVYETMKPKDAARILEKLDVKIMMDVVQRMNERKIAPVLAAMSPENAKTLTTELATRKPMPAIETGS